jgi:SAM-dependent methyltransferase
MTEVAGLYHRLVIVVGHFGSGKTAALQAVAERTGAPRINLNLELSRRLMDLTARQRALQLPALLNDILAAVPGDILLLDNIEILFDTALQQNPLHHFQAASRNRTVVVAWNGTVVRDDRGKVSLTYATPDHPEYRRYPATDLMLVESPGTA